MRSVQDQLAAVLARVEPVPPLDVALHDAVGCILAADVVAQADLPLHPLATRDGYAVASAGTSGAGGAVPLSLPVPHDVRAGAGAPLEAIEDQLVRADLLLTTGGLGETAAMARANALAVVPEDATAVRLRDHVHCIVLEG